MNRKLSQTSPASIQICVAGQTEPLAQIFIPVTIQDNCSTLRRTGWNRAFSVLSLWGLRLLLVLLVYKLVGQADDHGYSFATATPITPGNVISGNIEIPQDRDYFRLELPTGGIIKVNTSGEINTQLFLYDAEGMEGGLLSLFGGERFLNPGTWYIVLSATSITNVGSYVLQVEFTADPVRVERISQWPGYVRPSERARAVVISGGYAYVALGSAGLEVIDVRNPAAPARVGNHGTPWYATGLAVAERYVILVDQLLHVIDIHNPTQPVRVSSYDTPGEANQVVVTGRYAYVADGFAGLQVIDFNDPTKPTGVGEYDTPGYASRVAMAGKFAYVLDGAAGIQVIDVSDPSKPFQRGSYAIDHAVDLEVVGQFAYVGRGNNLGLEVIDFGDPAKPVRVGGCDVPGTTGDLVIAGKYAYLAVWYGGGFQMFDIGDPSNPVRVGAYLTPGEAFGVAVSGQYVYVADGVWGLQILRINEPVNTLEAPVLQVRRQDEEIELSWTPLGGKLENSTVLGPNAKWTVVGTNNPARITPMSKGFYRVVMP